MCLPLIKKLQNTTNKLWPAAAILVLLALWQTASGTGMVSKFLLPSPVDVVKAFVNDFSLLMTNARVTIIESFIGLLMGVVIGFLWQCSWIISIKCIRHFIR